jgi:restriction endonuclease
LLRDLLVAATAGRATPATIIGEPGIGKTRLAAEIAEVARASGAQVLWGRCWDGDGARAWNEELINYLSALQVNKSVYEYVLYESEAEREFARRLDEREDIRLFVKLPGWFEVETPVGKYNPDWAILKHDRQALYLVRETKGTRDFLKLRTSEADKVRCGQKHFETLGVSFAVAVTADEV